MCSCSPVDLDRTTVADLARAGCFQVCVGIQDVHEEVRCRVFHRFTPSDRITHALAALGEGRLRATVDNIVGWPGQSDSDLEDVGFFYLDHPFPGRFTAFSLIYFAGTDISEEAARTGILDEKEIRRLEECPTAHANTRLLGKGIPLARRQLLLFLVVMQWLPRAWSRVILSRELYRLLPPLPPGLVEGLWTLFTRDRLDPVRGQYGARLMLAGRQRLAGSRGTRRGSPLS